MTRREWIAAAGGFALAGCAPVRGSALQRGAEYLWRAQSDDGGWHSATYGLLRSGQSLTPFALDALLEVSPEVSRPPAGAVERAVSFLRSKTRPDGALGMADSDVPDYPNYATSLAVTALCRAKPREWEELSRRMAGYLRGQQFTEQNGWKPADPAYGAWGMGGVKRTPPDTGHVDLSMTRHVLDALRASGSPPSDPQVIAARVFVERCQNFDPARPDDRDGGFFFSTTEHDTNKAGHDGKQFRSYGTTTADGILALLATGAPPDHPRVRAAREWIVSRHQGMEVPGFAGEAYRRWPRGLAFYYAGVSALAFRALAVSAGPLVAEALERTQRPDGSWSNAENLVKEDDPLIATPFAVRALALASS